MLIRNARISGGDGTLVDVTINDGMIVSITDAATGLEADPQLDAAGRWLSPGLWDNHVHASQWALISRRLDLSSATSARDAADRVSVALEGSPLEGRALEGSALEHGQPFIGSGFRDALWPDAPSLDILDSASGGVPVVLVSADLHAVWLNSAALELYGHRGHPTGLIREDAAFEVGRSISNVPDEILDTWLSAAARGAAQRGVVGIVDLEMTWNLESWQRRMEHGFDSFRVEFGIYTEHLDRAVELGLRTGQSIMPLLSVGRYKVLTDGSLNTRTAYCYDEYPGLSGHEHSHGMLTVPPEQLVPRMRTAAHAGIEPTVHAIGDHATSLALDAFQEIGIGGRIEHAQLIRDTDIPRFAALGVTASVQPDHAMDDRDVAEKFWPGRTGRAFALRSLLDAGAELALGSDAPVSPLDPWGSIAAAVGRSRDGRASWHPEQCITAGEALAASTRNRVEVGEVADLILTVDDPITMTADQLRDVTVAATMVGGRLTHNTL